MKLLALFLKETCFFFMNNAPLVLDTAGDCFGGMKILEN